MEKKCTVIIPAAGQGRRMKSHTKKQYLELKGKPILAWTIEAFQKHPLVNRIIIVTSKEDIAYVQKEVVQPYDFKKVTDVIEGGQERQSSVKKGLDLVSTSERYVLVHDGVRPFIKEEVITKLVENLIHYKACAVGVPVKDTIKVINEDKLIVDTPDRDKLWAIQTPQAFHVGILKKAHKEAVETGYLGTDDTVLVERFEKESVRMLEGDYSNIKITTQEDLVFGEFYLDSK